MKTQQTTSEPLPACDGSVSIAEIHAEMQGQVYGDLVTMSECSAADFVTWYNWRMTTNPVEMEHNGRKIMLSEFDIESVVDLMAEWIKRPFDSQNDSGLPTCATRNSTGETK